MYLPTTAGGICARADRLRLRNLVRDADRQLAGLAVAARQRRELLSPLSELVADESFWMSTRRGLAIFIQAARMMCFRLPVPVPTAVTVGSEYHLCHLIPVVENDLAGYVLAVSHGRAQLYRVDKSAAEKVAVAGLPTSIQEVLNITGDDRGAQCHSAVRGHHGKQAAVFHGQGGRPDTAEDDLRVYFRRIDTVVGTYLGATGAPLLLATVPHLAALYRKTSSYRPLIDAVVNGNPDDLSDAQLHTRSWPLLKREFERDCDGRLETLCKRMGTNMASNDPQHVVLAACDGQVDTLFYTPDQKLWGHYDRVTNVVNCHDAPAAGDEDLVELAVAETLRHRGSVFSIPSHRLPVAAPLAAVMRYATETSPSRKD